MRWLEDFEEYHDKGDPKCPACMLTPTRCACGGWMHTQLNQDDLVEIQAMCDICYTTVLEDEELACAG